ncbi:protein Peter pan [Tribolium castaneum]|uniref:Protein Peter pan-like Protein n=1 Tax=Tribolium castaneum TaxID=7070 RepID=D6W8M2_TRICA|nr:PREDICTED: protein Peter pan [Tribolium castaneum]EEZ98288.1 Protein Peter pan-like Protein [Tribolium castaneum]|eukprot:XP_974431.1 PREDICTED: protein Peter pan [Tribolium castaneum]
MGKRRKGRCVKNNTNVHSEPAEVVQAPHSFVIHKGLPGGHLLELTKDFRKVMEPFTATSLKERKKNTVKDFVAVAGLLHVSHLMIFSRTEIGMYLKICRLPRGPTMTFKIHNFSLARDVVSSLKKQAVVEAAFKHSPLIVLNSFTSEGMHLKLMASMFQNMFPTINLTNVDLNNVRRCVLLNYNPTTKLIDFRHYTIKVIPVGISKGVKKVVQGKVPNLAKCGDISEFLTKSGMLSESEFEDDPSNHVTLSQKLISRGNIESGKSSIKLTELGPRLTLQLIKIEDGLLDGEVLYHDLIEKTDEEKLEIQKKREAKRKLKEARKKTQEKNKEKKENMKKELKEKSLEGMKKKESNEEVAVEDDNDAEYYKEEVGEEPDKDLFTQSQRKPSRPVQFRKRKSSEKPPNSAKKFKRNDGKSTRHLQNRDQRPIGGQAFGKGKVKNKRNFKK